MRERNTTTEFMSREFADKIAWNVDAPDFSNTPVGSRRPEFDYVPADAHAEPFVSIITAFHDADDLIEPTAVEKWFWFLQKLASRTCRTVRGRR